MKCVRTSLGDHESFISITKRLRIEEAGRSLKCLCQNEILRYISLFHDVILVGFLFFNSG